MTKPIKRIQQAPTQSLTKVRTFQSAEICRICGIKDVDAGQRLISTTLRFLTYLKPGDSIECSDLKLTSLSEDLLHFEHSLDLASTLDDLEARKVIKIPV
jgi:hypothetical protein